jgi:signal transduction histidine kinase
MPGPETSAAAHGALRLLVGFNLEQLAGEYRAFRATVLRLWHEEGGVPDGSAVEQITRFNEGVDQALAESVKSYSAHVAKSRDMFLAVLKHDLRNPLSSVSGCFELLANETLTVYPRKRALEIGRRSLVTIETLITDLLEYAKTRLGRGIEVQPKLGDIVFSHTVTAVLEPSWYFTPMAD